MSELNIPCSAAQAKRGERAAKSANKYGSPIALKSKILAAIADPCEPSCIYVAESAGAVRRVNVDVSLSPFSRMHSELISYSMLRK